MMKKFLFILIGICAVSLLHAQSPDKMSYQAIIRNSSDKLVISQKVGMRISILKGSVSGTAVYVETQEPTTNANGLISIEIGGGTFESGNLSDINWAGGPYFIKTEIDPTGASDYTITGTSQLLSVPYALYAKVADSVMNVTESQNLADVIAQNNSANAPIKNLTDPVDAQDAATKSYVDSKVSSGGWGTSGNASTSPASNFIGTTDNQPLAFRVNNVEKLRLSTNGALELKNSGGSVFIGNGAGSNDDLTNNLNVFVGDSTGFSNTTGYNNTAFGYQALYSNTTGHYNIATGYQAIYSNTTGNFNVANGYATLYRNTTGTSNTAIGHATLNRNTTGSYNTANGFLALNFNTTGSWNTAIGNEALYKNTTGYSNVAIGVKALHENTTQSNLVAIGDSALFNNGKGATDSYQGISNTAVGSKALFSNTTGNQNTAIGYLALEANTTGFHNTANGWRALENNTTGYSNMASGANSLSYNTTGYLNTACGAGALKYNISGSVNTGVGVSAGPAETYSDLSNTGAFGYYAQPTASNTIRIGNTSITQIGGYVGWSNLSDGRFKTNIKSNVPGLDFIMKLKPVTFSWDMKKLNAFTGINDSVYTKCPEMKKASDEKETKRFTGFIAQDVEQAAKECNYDFSAIVKPANDKTPYNLSYAEFVVPLVKAVQEQQKIIEKLQAKIEQLELTHENNN